MNKEDADLLAKHRLKMTKLKTDVDDLVKKKFGDDDDEDEESISGISDLDDDELRLKMEDISNLGEHCDPILKAARDFANSDHYRNIISNRITINGNWERPQFLCTNLERRGIKYEGDVEKTRDLNVSTFELFLLISDPIWCPDVFPKCIQEARAAKERGEGPELAHCLAWVSFAAQCASEKLLPPGEIFPEVDDYIKKYLGHPDLPLIEEDARVDLALCQVNRCFEFLCESDLSALSVSDRSFLLFLISRILLDRAMNVSDISTSAKALISHIFKTAEDERKVLLEFAQIFPYVSDDLRGTKVVLEAFRMAKVVPETCLCLMAAIFVHVSERSECAPEDPESLSPSDFIATYATVMTDTFVNVLDVFVEDRNHQAAVVSMVDVALHPDVFFSLPDGIRQLIFDRLEYMKRSWRRKGRTDDVILEMQVSNVISRLNEDIDDAMDDTVESTAETSSILEEKS